MWCFDCSYSTIAWVACLPRGRIDNVSYAYKPISKIDLLFRVFNALGQISFAFAGHAVTLEIQATIPSTPEKPSKIAMWNGAICAYFINAICYFPVAIIGYWTFGQDVNDNILMSLEKPSWLIASANLMVFIHVVGSYQVSTINVKPIPQICENSVKYFCANIFSLSFVQIFENVLTFFCD